MRDTGHEAERETAENEQDRVRNPQQRCESEQPGARTQDRQQNERVVGREIHSSMLSGEGHGEKREVAGQVPIAARDAVAVCLPSSLPQE